MPTSQVDLAAGQAFSTFSECDTGDAAMSGAFDVGANSTLKEFRPATTDPERWTYGGVNVAVSPLETSWWIVRLDMTPQTGRGREPGCVSIGSVISPRNSEVLTGRGGRAAALREPEFTRIGAALDGSRALAGAFRRRGDRSTMRAAFLGGS